MTGGVRLKHPSRREGSFPHHLGVLAPCQPKHWWKRYFNTFKKSSYSHFGIHICWMLILISILQSTLSEPDSSPASASCSDRTPSLAMMRYECSGTCVWAERFARFNVRTRDVLETFCARHAHSTSTCTAPHIEKLYESWNVRSKTSSANLLRDSFRSLGDRLSTVQLSRKLHDSHREVTRR